MAFNEDKDNYHFTMYRSRRDKWDVLVSEDVDISTPILGATETALREQIRKQAGILREMGVTDV